MVIAATIAIKDSIGITIKNNRNNPNVIVIAIKSAFRKYMKSPE